ncbi:prepilin-type N-terminal cleavage/methylation domain-containing protein [Dethiosulfovibrio salsuginis]|uniref:Prepilin-type N-terminal cleavage/methylation domain-containing protein n=1 Tax=Dethiosulfovibrio salsuginis TaxID=561720 RepID=A0A1X7J175_9BACT|nr:prepilin-type N-terminal cleavage/methylation domain-containing protein [Dethiosulfovibrio salsuginis]SMG21407.1 prepilin-type N-terminal cleavage/methylation domain-containing protein [Dethiosulfovibrio salsuginis]
MKRSGFTLVEVLVVLALVGVMATCAIAPMVHITGNLRDAQSNWGDRSAVEDSFRLIFRDVRSVLIAPSQTYCIAKRRDLMGGKADDFLAVATGSMLKTSFIPGTVVYGLIREDSLGMKQRIPGLYRWIYKGKRPDDLDLKAGLDRDVADMVLPYVDSFRVEVYNGKEWLGDYSGSVPPGIKLIVVRKGETYEFVDWFPSI